MVGYWLTMLLAPPDWYWMLAGFVLFRIFDIAKPWPVSLADRKISGGLGIMVDDVLAAVYAWLAMQLLIWLVV
jgi:phosphatidylglycerophosphatase A